ncbi:hypothetical protein [Algicola sagamiensis]|uniref:hypothetical protein n=1 Tax=Algicola sagamiensis TaxID=163869 RepID=UPI00036D3348|nr:hypothetical protein [Algicola sagamiensis]
MAQTKLILTDKDMNQLVLEFFKDNICLVPDRHYPTNEIERLHSIEEFQSAENAKHYYLLHENWTHEPLVIDQVDSPEEGTYFYISPKKGGPTVDFYFTGELMKDGRRYAGLGYINYAANYWSTTKQCMQPAPEASKQFYTNFVNDLRKRSRVKRDHKSTFWMSLNAEKLIHQGVLHLQLDFLAQHHL